MAGLATQGMPAFSAPFTGSERVNMDTGKAGGVAPQTAAVTSQLLSIIGKGAVLPLADAATISADATKGSYFSVTIGATGRTLTVSNPSPGQEILIEVTQDGTGSRTITTWTNFTWAGGTAPTLTTTAGATDAIRATWNATAAKWRAETVAKALA